MDAPRILLTFKGSLSFEDVTTLIESKIHTLEEDLPTRKKIYNVLVECVQNIAHHAIDANAASITVTMEANSYNIYTTNTILRNDGERLRGMLDKVNKFTREELTESYKKTLSNGKTSLKGTAGLGIMDIARKSGQRLTYEFTEVDDKYSIFNLSINVPRKTKTIVTNLS